MKAIKYSAAWCGPCKMLTKKLEQDGIIIEERDIDSFKEDVMKYGIRSVPAIVILDKDGNRMETMIGANLTETQFKRLKELSL